ncbi:MAG TPA: hypothetical protein VLT88_03060 [Desulfosarcina sp.]|nr:hypothetical protein [Desulfosarcina sp.]
MQDRSNGPSMSQKIFTMNLDVETVSLYLLCCALADGGAAVTATLLMEKWNGDRAGLEQAMQRLEERNIIVRSAASPQGEPTYQIVHEKDWR